jgi:hypothetical protein
LKCSIKGGVYKFFFCLISWWWSRAV